MTTKRFNPRFFLITSSMAIGLEICPPSTFGSDKDGKDHFSNLPEEAKQAILHHVPPKELGALAQVNKDLHNQTSDDLLWKKKVFDTIGPTSKGENESWKDVYKRIDRPLNLLKTSLSKIKNDRQTGSQYARIFNKLKESDPETFAIINMVEENKTEEEIYEKAIISKLAAPGEFRVTENPGTSHEVTYVASLKELTKILEGYRYPEPNTPANYWFGVFFAYTMMHSVFVDERHKDTGPLVKIFTPIKDYILENKLRAEFFEAIKAFIKHMEAIKGSGYRANVLKNAAAKNP
ncbi:MAG: F-box protein [Alphaproteobacteria bacterium]